MVWKRIFGHKKKSNSSQCALVLRAEGIELAVVSPTLHPKLEYLGASADERTQVVAQLTENHRLKGSHCQLVLTPGMYQVLQVDKPNVPEAEMAGALRWAIKDLVTMPLDELVMDYYESPVQAQGQAKLNVVTCNKALLTPVIAQLNQSQVQLVGISIEELSLTSLLMEEAPQLLVFHSPDEELLLLIVKQGQLYFTRRLRGYNQIHQMSEAELQLGVLDNLSLELQRSMDYLQRQLRQEPVSKIAIAIQNPAIETILQGVQLNVEVPVELFKIERGDEQYHQSLVALGALQQLTEQAETA